MPAFWAMSGDSAMSISTKWMSSAISSTTLSSSRPNACAATQPTDRVPYKANTKRFIIRFVTLFTARTDDLYDLYDLYDLFPLQFMIQIFQGRCIPDMYDLYDLYDLFPLQFMIQIFQGRSIPDLYNLYDLYDLYNLAHVAGMEATYDLALVSWVGSVPGWKPYNLHDVAHVSWVGSVLRRS